METRFLSMELAQENYASVIKSLDNCIAETPEEELSRRSKLIMNRGWCHQQLGMNRKALKDFQEATKLGCEEIRLYLYQGEALWSLKKEEEARKVWTEGISTCDLSQDLKVVQSIMHRLENPDQTQHSQRSQPNGHPVNNSHSNTGPCMSERNAHILKHMNADKAVEEAVEMINRGDLNEAEMLLEELEKQHRHNPAVYIARGTARALLRKLEEAVEDFSKSIEIMPMYAEGWKRRSQARGALNQNEEALEDLEKAMQLSGDSLFKSECLMEQGMIHHKTKDYRRAVSIIEKSLGINPQNPQAINLLGLCLISLGEIEEGLEAYDKTIELDPTHKDVGRVREAEEAYREGRIKDKEIGRSRYLGINRIMASLYQGMGQHEKALPFLNEVIESSEERQRLESLFLRAVCYHALGHHQEANEDYTQCMQFEKYLERQDPIEKRQLIVLAFYQKEMCLYVRHNIDKSIYEFCLDKDLSPLFKELWCKKMSPTTELISNYTFQKSINKSVPEPMTMPTQEQIQSILDVAKAIGILLQNSHHGFLPNQRQQLSAGCAAIELAQAILADLEARRSSQSLKVLSSGSSGACGDAPFHPFHWRDAMDILVKWRQLSEPNDQVVWVDQLTPEEFASGFGSHTPMFSGQTKCVRYYMNFDRALKKQKEVLIQSRKAFNSGNEEILIQASEQRIMEAQTACEMYSIIGQDSWVVVPICSLARPTEMMEGTRLTLVKVPDQENAFEFSIRTPVTPPRWAQFEADLKLAWENFMNALATDDKERIAQCIMTYVYYWYNFMPLARGTAACGYTTLLALFWAAGMPISVTIPKGYQVDWEAILEPHSDIFMRALYQWMVPEIARPLEYKGSTKEGSNKCGRDLPSADSVPKVKDYLNTMRRRIQALNGLKSDPI